MRRCPQRSEWLAAFYDPPSRRMKVAISCDEMHSVSFLHRGRAYHQLDRFAELATIYSKDGKIIGFGVIDDLTDEHYFRPAINALNAVVDGRRNDLNPERDAFAEIMKSGTSYPQAYWWLTETWEDFVKQVEDLNWPIVESFPLWNGDPFVWEGVVNGKPDGDFILFLEEFGFRKIGFKLVTENIPKRILDLQTFQNPSSQSSS